MQVTHLVSSAEQWRFLYYNTHCRLVSPSDESFANKASKETYIVGAHIVVKCEKS